MKRYIYTFVLVALSCLGLRAAQVDTVTIATPHLNPDAKAIVIVPESASQDSTAKFPTVYLLHGYGGDYTNWITKQPRIKDLADQYGMIIVCPDGRNSWYWDCEGNPDMQMETFFTDDLVPYVDSHYPTRPEASQRAITGLSMGGHGALWLAIRHNDIWGNAGTMSGGVDIRPFKDRWSITKLIGTDNAAWEAHTVMNLVPNINPATLNLTIDCGIDDFFADVNYNLHKALVDARVPHDYTSRPGKHSWDYWNNSVLYHLLFFNEHFKK